MKRKIFTKGLFILILLIAIPLFFNFISGIYVSNTKEVKQKIKIYSATNDKDKFIIIQKTEHRLLASDLTLYSFLEESSNGKSLKNYDVRDISIKDTLKLEDHPYESITKEIDGNIITNEKIVLYLPNNYEIDIK